MVIVHRPDEISATEISPRWNGIKRFHWAGWAGRAAKIAEILYYFALNSIHIQSLQHSENNV
jgi:hypothetical protein